MVLDPLGPASSWVLNRRREGRESRAAARMLMADLDSAQRVIAAAVSENDWSRISPDALRLEAWQKGGHTLAEALSNDEWSVIHRGVRAVQTLSEQQGKHPDRRFPVQPEGQLADGEGLRTALDDIGRAILGLERLASWREPADTARVIG